MRVGFLHEMYATRGDLEPGLRRVEALTRVDYVLTGLFDSDEVRRYGSALDLPHLGLAPTGDQTLEPSYMILPAGAAMDAVAISQRRGGVKYAVDPRDHPSGHILFSPGGVYREGVLISGELGTALKDEVSAKLFRMFYKELFKGFVKIKVNYVGPEALSMLRRGWRLTQSVKGVGELVEDKVLPVPESAPGVWGKDLPEMVEMREEVKE